MRGEFDGGVRRTAVLDDVLQGLLSDSKKAEADVLRELAGNGMVDELNPQFELIGDFFAQGVHGSNQTKNFQPGGMELLGDGVQAGGNFGGDLGDATELIPGMRRKAGHILLELTETYLEEGHPLI